MTENSAKIEPLTQTEEAVLECENRRFSTVSQKTQAIRELGYSLPEYYLLLGQILEKPAAHFAYPELVRRLLSLRAQRGAERHGSLRS